MRDWSCVGSELSSLTEALIKNGEPVTAAQLVEDGWILG
jgi:hypothetical protein